MQMCAGVCLYELLIQDEMREDDWSHSFIYASQRSISLYSWFVYIHHLYPCSRITFIITTQTTSSLLGKLDIVLR